MTDVDPGLSTGLHIPCPFFIVLKAKTTGLGIGPDWMKVVFQVSVTYSFVVTYSVE